MNAPPVADDSRWAALAARFDKTDEELLPKPFKKDSDRGQCTERTKDRNGVWCGGYHGLPAIHLTYIGHAGVTIRLNQVDPTWSWEPMYRDVNQDLMRQAMATGDAEIVRMLITNSPMKPTDGGLWINLTILGVTRPGFGDAQGKSGPNATKELIGDAIRNAAMRFGVGTYLWSKAESATAAVIREEGVDVDAQDVTPSDHRQHARTQARQQVRQSAPAGPPTDNRTLAAAEIAKQAADKHNAEILLPLYSSTKALHDVDVRGALTEQQLAFAPIADGQPVPLGVWLKTCGTHARQQSMSINDAIKLDPAHQEAHAS